LLEEEKIMGYYAGRHLYADPGPSGTAAMSDGHDDFAFEPDAGASRNGLPEGEKSSFGKARPFKGLAIRSFHVRKVAIYFAILAAWRVVEGLHGGAGLGEALIAASGLIPVAAVGVGLLSLFAWLYARSSVFTITSRRVVMRFGLALPMAINLPFTRIEGAGHRRYRSGDGDIPLALAEGERIAYLHLWPFARPWRLKQPEPMMRALSDSDKAAAVLADALQAFIETEEVDGDIRSSTPVRLARPSTGGVRAAAPFPKKAAGRAESRREQQPRPIPGRGEPEPVSPRASQETTSWPRPTRKCTTIPSDD
jgi:hypothetical protein